MSSALNRLCRTEGFRLTAIFAIAFALSVIAMGAIVLFMNDRALRDQVTNYAQANVASISDGYQKQGLSEAREIIDQYLAAPANNDYFVLQRGSKRLAGNLPVMAPRVGVFGVNGANGSPDILGVGQLLSADLYVYSGSDLSQVHAVQARMRTTLIWLFAAGLVIAIAGGALVSRGFLQRTDGMATACRAIMGGDMRRRIPVRGSGDELDRLATAINEMLDRISALMENLRQVTNDVAHDLRTPVTHLRSGLERAHYSIASENPLRQELAQSLVRCDEILAMFTSLLRIAQIEGGARRSAFSPIDLGELVLQVRELFDAVADEAAHHLSVDVVHNAIIRGDRSLLTQLFSNLVENAILHTPPGTQIALHMLVRNERAVVRVSDNGPGVPKEEHDKIFQRLYRREASRTNPGYGLGLSIVQAIAELHGATLQVIEQSEPGLVLEITFPLAPSIPIAPL